MCQQKNNLWEMQLSTPLICQLEQLVHTNNWSTKQYQHVPVGERVGASLAAHFGRPAYAHRRCSQWCRAHGEQRSLLLTSNKVTLVIMTAVVCQQQQNNNRTTTEQQQKDVQKMCSSNGTTQRGPSMYTGTSTRCSTNNPRTLHTSLTVQPSHACQQPFLGGAQTGRGGGCSVDQEAEAAAVRVVAWVVAWVVGWDQWEQYWAVRRCCSGAGGGWGGGQI